MITTVLLAEYIIYRIMSPYKVKSKLYSNCWCNYTILSLHINVQLQIYCYCKDIITWNQSLMTSAQCCHLVVCPAMCTHLSTTLH